MRLKLTSESGEKRYFGKVERNTGLPFMLDRGLTVVQRNCPMSVRAA